MRELRILFTGAGRRVELLQAFRQAAQVLGVSLKLYGADMAGTAPALAFCDFSRKICAMKDMDYIPGRRLYLRDFIKRRKRLMR